MPELIDISCQGTACVSLVSKKVIHVANLGDSRAVLARVPNTENGKIETIELSQDHHPSLEAEKKRIEDGGGFVEKFFGTTRACAASSSVMLVSMLVYSPLSRLK